MQTHAIKSSLLHSTRINPIEQEVSKKNFNTICNYAYDQDEERLRHFLQAHPHFILDAKEKGRVSRALGQDIPAQEFFLDVAGVMLDIIGASYAREGCKDKVLQCLEEGANINVMLEFAAEGRQVELTKYLLDRGASLHFAMYGAGKAGDKTLINELLAEGGSINAAVKGAAFKQHEDLVSALIVQGASIDFAINGAIQGGCISYAKKIMAKYNYHYQEKQILSFAMAGEMDVVRQMLAAESSIASGMLKHAVRGAAMFNSVTFVEELLGRGGSLNQAAYGAAFAGNVRLLNELLVLGASPNFALWGAALAGHAALTDKLLQKGAWYYAFSGAIQRENYNLFNTLLLKCGDTEGWVARLKLRLQPIFAHENIARRFLLTVPDSLLHIFTHAVQKAKIASFDTQPLAVEIRQIKHDSSKYGLSFNLSHTWQQSSIQGVLMFYISTAFLPKDLIFLIATFLAPSALISPKEIEDLYTKIAFPLKKMRIMHDLKNLPQSFFFWNNSKKITLCKEKCAAATSPQALQKVLNEEISTLTGEVHGHSALKSVLEKNQKLLWR